MKNKISGVSIAQNEQEFIIGKMAIKDILQFTRYTERLIIGYDEEEKPIYNKHIQRKVESSRVNKIADFLIYDPDATFPTNIVLGVPMSIIDEQVEENGIITIHLNNKVSQQIDALSKGNDKADVYITIIDGQHRIRGIEIAIEKLELSINSKGNILNAEEKLSNLLNIELVVSYFIDKSLEYQAMIFSTINRTQKRVSQDLVYSLFGLSSDDTPYKSALEIVLALNGHPRSPFYKRVRLYGGSYDRFASPPLSQATMIKNIVALISESLRDSENDKYKKRKDLLSQTSNKYLPFRLFYANDNDAKISDCLFYYFNSVSKYLFDFWDYNIKGKPTNILHSTIGFEALLKLLVDILQYDTTINSFNSTVFDKYIEPLTQVEFGNLEEFPMTTGSKSKLYLNMYILALPLSDIIQQKKDKLAKIINNSTTGLK